MIVLFKLLFVIFALFAMSRIWQKGRQKEFSQRATWFWLCFWLASIVAVVWPDSTTIIANRFGIGRGTDFVLYVSLALMFYALFRLHVKIEHIRRDVTQVVRDRAIEEGEQ